MSGNPNIFKTLHAQFLVENLNLARASGVEDAKWEHFQLDHLNDDGFFRIEKKSRQIAWSFLSAMEAVAKAMVYGGESVRQAHLQPDSIMVSINHEESKEKIRYAKAVYENLEIGGLPKLIIDNQQELEFDNGARITSMPSKGPRGRAKSNVYLDEFAHVMHDRQIYTAAIPIISKGGVLRIGSSTFGASGVFWEVYGEQMQKYPGYTRKSTPWWEVQAFCKNVREAWKLAPQLETFERVNLFGNDRIKAIFANLPLEDFQQEYEAVFVDETTAWISWAEIKQAQNEDLFSISCTAKNSALEEVFQAIDDLRIAINRGECEDVLYGGMDIGRTRHTTEIFLNGKKNDIYSLRLQLSLGNFDFDAQLAVIDKLFEVLPISSFLMDQTGIGRNLAEKAMQKYPAKVLGVDFTNQSKQMWATDTKMFFQQNKVRIPVDRDLAYQIHSIKKIVSPSKNLIFDTDRNEKHHADKFWAEALSLKAASTVLIQENEQTTESFYQF